MTKKEEIAKQDVHEIIYKSAKRLAEGDVVLVDGLYVRAIKAPVDMFSCDICEMDCIGHKMEGRIMPHVCAEVDRLENWEHYLKIV